VTSKDSDELPIEYNFNNLDLSSYVQFGVLLFL
jgi:hypothetical protein